MAKDKTLPQECRQHFWGDDDDDATLPPSTKLKAVVDFFSTQSDKLSPIRACAVHCNELTFLAAGPVLGVPLSKQSVERAQHRI